MLGNTLIDNSQNLKLVDTLNEIINISEIKEICIATGYWDLKGTALITEALNNFLQREGTKLRLLIGKDPNVYQKDLTADSYKTAKQYPQDFIKIDLQNVELNNQAYQNAANLLMKYCNEDKKIEVHIFKLNEDDEKQFFHSKCYIFMGLNGKTFGIVGSSNFTQKGLEGNSELNYLDTDTPHITAEPTQYSPFKGHYYWFNEKWNLSEDWTKEFVVEVQNSPVGKEAKKTPYNPTNLPPVMDSCSVLSPYETYIKLLQDQFAEVIDSDGKIKEEDYLPKPKAKNFKKLTYQLEAVNQGFAIMKRHNGFILADVVGLGKTYTALMIVKRHLLETGFKHPVLIITPPAVYQSWVDSINFFDEDEIEGRKLSSHITLTTIGCLDTDSDITLNGDEKEDVAIDDFDSKFVDDDYGMIVVDESHRFRNDGTQMYQKLDDLIGNITARLGKQPYVALLSATPQNNAPYDLRNQIFLFQRNYRKSESIENLGQHGSNLLEYFGEKQKNYKTYIQRDKPNPNNPKERIPKTKAEIEEDRRKLREDSEDIRKRIIEQLVIRRTRTDIANFYKKDMQTQDLHFPKIMPPQPLLYEMGEEQGRLFIDTIDIIASEVSYVDVDENGNSLLGLKREPGEDALGYYRYRAIEFLKSEEHKQLYEANNLKVSGTSERLAQLTEMNLVKRLESSIAAFRESLHNLETYTQNMIDMFNVNRIFICPDLDINKELSSENKKKNGGFEQCLNIIAQKAKKKNQEHQTTHNAEFKKTDFTDDYIIKLNNDLKLIKELCSKWDKQTEDKKMQNFIWTAASTIFDKKRNPEQRLVIFTECIATQKELYKVLSSSPIREYGILSVDASNRNDLKETIAANFDANYKGDIIESERDKYKILITTDVLAEGVNLHRANSILNYDSPWNATKLMQRLGRINRIGTKADKIWNYNFYPSTLGDNQINLKNRTYIKLQSFHELFGEDSQIYSNSEEVKHFDKVEYDTVDDSMTPIMPYIAELREFKEKKPSDYERLLNIQNLALTQTTNPILKAFSSLHLLNANKDLIQSSLYISTRDDKKTYKVDQLQFFELLKPLAQLELTQSLPIDYKAFESNVIAKFKAEKQNASQARRQENKEGLQNEETAYNKMQAIIEIEDLEDDVYDMIDDICDAITNGNRTVIKQVLKTTLKDEGLGHIILTEEIRHLWKYTNYNNKDCMPEVKIIFVD